MFKLLALACVLLALSSVHSQSCSTTSNLRDLYGFANTVTSPTPASGVNYCKSIKSSSVCCTASDINSIPDKSAKTIANLTSLVSARDVYIKTVKDTVIPTLISSFNALLPIATQFEAFVTATNATGFDDLVGSLGDIFSMGEYLVANLSAIKTDYVGYQNARSSCVVEMVSLQNAAYCLACDPNAGTKGYSYQNAVNFFDLDDTVCSRLKTSCSAYIEDSVGQNALIASSYGATLIGALGSALQGLMTGDMAAVQTLATAFDSESGPKTASVAPADTPDGCDGGSCDWICTDLFYNGEVDQLSLVSGGVNILDSGRRLAESGNKRMLAGSWSPDKDESGVTVTFASDPAGTNNAAKSASMIGNVFVSMMVVISAMLLL